MTDVGPNVDPPTPLTQITSAWGSQVTADLAELWAAKASTSALDGLQDQVESLSPNVITLNAGAPIPPGTPPGTLILVVPV